MEKVIKLIPVIYALLLFSGYLNYATYYRQFDIQIVSYLTTAELLLSFLPLTNGILFLFLFFSLYIIVDLTAIANGKMKITDNQNEIVRDPLAFLFIKNYKRTFRRIATTKRTSISSLTFFIAEVIISIVSILAFIFFIAYFFIIVPLLVESKITQGMIQESSFILSLFWFILLFEIIMKAALKLKNPISDQLVIASTIVIYLCLIAISNKESASRIILGKPLYQVSLEFNDKLLKTDSNFLYVGKTEKYFIFFVKDSKNSVFYPIDNVSKIQLSKVK